MFRCFTIPNRPAITNMTLIPGTTDEYTMKGMLAEVFFVLQVCNILRQHLKMNLYFCFLGSS